TAFVRLAISLPRLHRPGGHRIKVIAKNPPRGARLFIGLPPGAHDRAFLRGTGEPRVRELASMLSESRVAFGADREIVGRQLMAPAGDRRMLERRSGRWLVPEAPEFVFPDVRLRPGKVAHVTIGLHVPALD